MKKSKNIKKPISQMKSFLKKNPHLNEALRIFDISYGQYQKALNNVSFYTDISTTSLNTASKK